MEPVTHRPGRRHACSTAPTSTRTRSSPSSSSSASSAPASASSSSTTGARSPAGTCRPTRSSSPGRNFGCGSIARARAVGAAGLRLPGGRRPELRRHLLLQLHEDRAAAGRAARGGRARADGRPGEAEVDLEALEVRFDGRAVPFEIDAETPPPAAQRASTTSRSRSSRTTRSTPTSATASAPGPGHHGAVIAVAPSAHGRRPARRRAVADATAAGSTDAPSARAAEPARVCEARAPGAAGPRSRRR